MITRDLYKWYVFFLFDLFRRPIWLHTIIIFINVTVHSFCSGYILLAPSRMLPFLILISSALSSNLYNDYDIKEENYDSSYNQYKGSWVKTSGWDRLRKIKGCLRWSSDVISSSEGVVYLGCLCCWFCWFYYETVMLFDSVTSVLEKIYRVSSIMKLLHKQYMAPIGVTFISEMVFYLRKHVSRKFGKKRCL